MDKPKTIVITNPPKPWSPCTCCPQCQARIADLERQLAEAQKLSVTNIHLSGDNYHAKSVAEVVDTLTKLADEADDNDIRAIAAEQELAHADECICDLMHLMHNGFWGRMVFNLRRQVNGLRKAVKYIRLSHIDHAGHRAGKYRKTVEVCDEALAALPTAEKGDGDA